jgi:hypothetical protein
MRAAIFTPRKERLQASDATSRAGVCSDFVLREVCTLDTYQVSAGIDRKDAIGMMELYRRR